MIDNNDGAFIKIDVLLITPWSYQILVYLTTETTWS